MSYGVVWCGILWCGRSWCCVVSHGVVWCLMVWCGVVSYGVVWCGVLWCDVTYSEGCSWSNTDDGYQVQWLREHQQLDIPDISGRDIVILTTKTTISSLMSYHISEIIDLK